MKKYKFKWDSISREDGFIVQLFFLFFFILERISVFYWVCAIAVKINECRKHKKDTCFAETHTFSELWVVGNIVWAVFGYHVITRYVHNVWILYAVAIYAGLRIFEMFVYQVNVLFFHRLNTLYLKEVVKASSDDQSKKEDDSSGKKEYAIKSATRTVLLLLLNIIEYVLQFALVLSILSKIGHVDPQIGMYESFSVFMNISQIEGLNTLSMLVVVQIETILGLFMDILCLARFVSLLPEVARLDD